MNVANAVMKDIETGVQHPGKLKIDTEAGANKRTNPSGEHMLTRDVKVLSVNYPTVMKHHVNNARLMSILDNHVPVSFRTLWRTSNLTSFIIRYLAVSSWPPHGSGDIGWQSSRPEAADHHYDRRRQSDVTSPRDIHYARRFFDFVAALDGPMLTFW